MFWIFVACAARNPGIGAAASSPALEVSYTQELGVLALLNNPGTTAQTLTAEVLIEARAAEALIAHRDGLDGRLGSSDDDLFDDLAEVDAVPYVGSGSLQRLVTYAQVHGYDPAGLAGSWEGVPFTPEQVAATLRLVNEAPPALLGSQVQLDERAVDSIVVARPITSMEQLTGLYWVGPGSMAALRDSAPLQP